VQRTLDEAFTFAHAAVVDPGWRSHFLVIGTDAWLDDQIEVAAYLDLPDRARSKQIPFIWIVREGTLVRAVISWRLAFACRDRARAWRILQELAGTENAYARRAAEEARRTALEEADRRIEKLEADFAIALELAGSRGAQAAVEKLIRLLADPQGLQAAIATASEASGTIPSSPASAVTAEIAVPSTQSTESRDAPPAPGAAYIDSFLCTTCNDCIDVNPRMFRYNDNKQAELTDPAAGTFKELVKAAEVCPARCIHPGTPCDGDTTTTPALIERAAKFV
jgi:ferredoxin